MDEKFIHRFHSFCSSLTALSEARERDMSDSFVLSGTSAKFSITFELAWKVMKDILVQHYSIINFVSGSPKEVLKQSFQAKLIDDQRWLAMLQVRNQLAHDYDGEIIREYCERIRNDYVDLFQKFEKTVQRLLEGEET